MLHSFSYVSPETRADLLDFMAEKKGRAKILAGGTDLFVDIRAGMAKPDYIVDLKKVEEYSEIGFSLEEGLSIWPAVTLIQLMERGFVNSDYPLIAQAACEIGSKQLRNRATALGNICTASPAGDMAPAFLALGAKAEIASVRGVRTIPLSEFFQGVKKSVLAEDEILERIIVPAEIAGHQGRMMKMKRIKGHDLAVVSVAMAVIEDKIRFAAASCSPVPVFIGEFLLGDSVDDIVDKALTAVSPIDDVRASADYRRFMLSVYIKRLMDIGRSCK